MTGLALQIDWSGAAPDPRALEAMLASIAHRGSQSKRVGYTNACMGCVSANVSDSMAEFVPSGRATTDKLACVADARIDNAPELRQDLGLQDVPALCDAELLLRGYERWGVKLADKLVGDFAFAIWDQARRELYAARDPFGLRTLYYTQAGPKLILASEMDELLALGTNGRTLRDEAVLSFLEGTVGDLHNTFYDDLFRVPPGHWLHATGNNIKVERYFGPAAEVPNMAPDDCPPEFGRRFRRAVADRLRTRRPLIAQLSGGLDSTAIVCVADDICGSATDADASSVNTASALYPGLECDESAYIRNVTEKVIFSSYTWDATEAPSEAPEVMNSAHPWASTAAEPKGEYLVASMTGAEGIIGGQGGDQLLFERGIFRDLAAHGHWSAFMHSFCVPWYTSHSRAFFLGMRFGV